MPGCRENNMRVGWAVVLLLGHLWVGCSTTGTSHGAASRSTLRNAAGGMFQVAMASPAEMAAHTVTSGAVQMDAFEALLLYAGLDNHGDVPPAGHPLSRDEAARVLGVLLRKPVTLA